MVVAALVATFGPTIASADTERVLIADRDPELVRAIERTLAPWRMVVLTEPDAPSRAAVSVRAKAVDARFVVWREHDELIVFDRAHATTVRRPARAGRFDPVDAAAAALTVKTMMRLPDPPPRDGELSAPHAADATTGVVTAANVAATTPDGAPEVRLQASVAARVARGSQVDLGARGAFAIALRPWAQRSWRAGVAIETGNAATVNDSGFKGQWRDAALLVTASWTHEGRVDLEPWIAVGALRITLDGSEMTVARHETAHVGILRFGTSISWRSGRWAVGGFAAVDALLSTPTYIKAGAGKTSIFDAPTLAASIGVVTAASLGW